MVRAYLAGEREVGVRRGSAVDPFDAVAAYVRQLLPAQVKHAWGLR